MIFTVDIVLLYPNQALGIYKFYNSYTCGGGGGFGVIIIFLFFFEALSVGQSGSSHYIIVIEKVT